MYNMRVHIDSEKAISKRFMIDDHNIPLVHMSVILTTIHNDAHQKMKEMFDEDNFYSQFQLVGKMLIDKQLVTLKDDEWVLSEEFWDFKKAYDVCVEDFFIGISI